MHDAGHSLICANTAQDPIDPDLDLTDISDPLLADVQSGVRLRTGNGNLLSTRGWLLYATAVSVSMACRSLIATSITQNGSIGI